MARWIKGRRTPWLYGMLVSAAAGMSLPVQAQPMTGVILYGPSSRQAAAGAPAPLVPGVRIQAPPASWTEIAFSDGTSIVLEPGADFTLQGVDRRADGQTIIRGSAARGRLRASTSDRTELVLQTGKVAVHIAGSAAIVVAGEQGSATLLSGRAITLTRSNGDESLRRPGFQVSFGDGTIQRQTSAQLADSVDGFAPVKLGRNTPSRGKGGLARSAGGEDEQRDALQNLTGLNANAGATLATNNQGITRPGPDNPPNPTPPSGGSSQRGAYAPGAGFSNSLIGGTPPGGFGLAAPGQDYSSSAIDGLQNKDRLIKAGLSSPERQVDSVGYSDFGTARIRRIAPSLDDTGRVEISIVDSYYRNTLSNPLPNSRVATATDVPGARAPDRERQVNYSEAVPGPIVYDITGRVGYFVEKSGGNRDAAPVQYTRVDGRVISGQTFYPALGLADGNTPLNRQSNPPAGSPSGLIWIGAYPAITQTSFREVTSTIDPNKVVLQGSPRPVLLGQDTENPGLLIYIGPDVQANAPDVGLNATPVTGNGASIYIADKVTAGVLSRGIQPGERYFAIGGTSVGNGLQNRMPISTGTLPPGTVRQFAISDGLNPTLAGGLNSSQDLPTQFFTLSGSPTPNAFTANNGFRPESSFPGSGAPKGDTHLYAVAGDGSAFRPNVVMRADLQVLANGASTGAVSVGGLMSGPDAAQSLVLSGQTIGSTRLAPNQGALAIRSNLGSLATGPDGLSAHLLGTSTLNNGEISFFAISQADPRLQATNTGTPGNDSIAPAGSQPGRISNALGEQIPFAYTRLAISVPTGTTQVGGPAVLQGYAATLVERQGAGIYAQSSDSLGSVRIIRGADSNTFDMVISLRPTGAGESAFDPQAALAPIPANPANLTLGGIAGDGTPRSAWVSNGTYAALGNGVAAVSVDASLLPGIVNNAPGVVHPVTGASLPADLPASNEHVGWGYFLGDLATGPSGTTDRANLGFWVAGRPVDAGTISTLRGTATYSGGMIGTAIDADGMRTVAGRFAQSWDFGARAGRMNASFDQRNFNGVGLGMAPSTATFTGVGASGDRTLSVQGNFFHAGAPLGGTSHPAAVGGQFGITAPNYGANGIFVGGRR